MTKQIINEVEIVMVELKIGGVVKQASAITIKTT